MYCGVFMQKNVENNVDTTFNEFTVKVTFEIPWFNHGMGLKLETRSRLSINLN